MTSAFPWQNSISLCPASFYTPRTNLPVTPGISWLPTFTFQSLIMKVKSESESHSVVSDSLWPHELYSPLNSPGQNTRVGSLSLLQGIFPSQGLNPGLPHCRHTLYQLSPKGSPRILEWVAYPFSSESSQPRNRTGVSYTACGFFTNWAITEALSTSLISESTSMLFFFNTFQLVTYFHWRFDYWHIYEV